MTEAGACRRNLYNSCGLQCVRVGRAGGEGALDIYRRCPKFLEAKQPVVSASRWLKTELLLPTAPHQESPRLLSGADRFVEPDRPKRAARRRQPVPFRWPCLLLLESGRSRDG